MRRSDVRFESIDVREKRKEKGDAQRSDIHSNARPNERTMTGDSTRTHPKFSVMIKEALTHLNDRNGSSKAAILKYILTNYKVNYATVNQHLKMSLRAGIKNQTLKQTKGVGASGSFKLAAPVEKPKKKPVAKKPTKVVKKKTATEEKKKTPSATKKAAAKPKAKAKPKPKVKAGGVTKAKAKVTTPKKKVVTPAKPKAKAKVVVAVKAKAKKVATPTNKSKAKKK